jgi:hypothetical protein
LRNQCVDQQRWHAGVAKAADHDDRAVMDVGHGALD